MKKWLPLFVCILILSGCAQLYDLQSTYQLGDKMQKVMDQRNKSVIAVKDALDIHDKVIDELNAMKDQTKLKDLSHQVDETKKSLQNHKDVEEKILDQLPNLQNQSALLEDPTIQELANTFLTDFKKGIEDELEYLAAIDQMLDADATVIKDLQNGKEESRDLQNKAKNEVNRLAPLSNQSIEKFNQSWKEFRNRVPEVE